MPGLYYGDFSVGQVFHHAVRRTVTQTDNILFCSLTLNPQPLHLDRHFCATKSEFGQPMMNSIFTLGLIIGLSVHDTTLGTTIANLGMRDVRFDHPVFEGDTLHAKTKVISCRDSRSRPEAGLVEFAHTGFNQDDVAVAFCLRTALMHKAPNAKG